MTTISEMLTGRSSGPPPEGDRLNAGDKITRATGLRVDWSFLSDREQTDLVALVGKARTDGGGLNTEQQLDGRERTKFERLTGKACGEEGLFDRVREEDKMRKSFAELAARAKRPPRRPKFEEPGAVILSKEVTFDWLNRPGNPIVYIEWIGLHCFILAQLENGEALVPGGRIDGGGDEAALVIDMGLGLGARFSDPRGRLRWKEGLDHLSRVGLLDVTRNGPELRVRRGSRTLATTKGRKP